MRTALYARVSTERQERQQTIDSQLTALRAWAAANGHQLAEEHVFRDEGYSGGRLDRPGLDALRDAVRDGAVGVVAVLTPDRLARKYAYQVLLLEEFCRAGCEVVFLQHPISDDPNDQLLLQIQGAIAEYERAVLGERFRRGKLQRARDGHYLGGRAPYGYRYVPRHDAVPGHLVVDEAEADLVRTLYGWLIDERMTIRQILKRLNGGPHLPRSGRHAGSPSTVHHILADPIYAGTAYANRYAYVPAAKPRTRRGPRTSEATCRRLKPREQWIAIPVPALVDAETWDRAQAQLAHNAALSFRNNSRHNYLLRCLLTCETCGLAMYGITRPATARKPERQYYECRGKDCILSARTAACPSRSIKAQDIEAAVWDHVAALLAEPERLLAQFDHLAAAAEAGTARERAAELQIRARLDRVARADKRLLDAYEAGAVNLAELTERRRHLAEERRTLERQWEERLRLRQQCAQAETVRTNLAAFCTRIRSRLDAATFDEKQVILQLVIERIIVGSGRLEIRHVIPLRPPQPGSDGPAPSANRLRSDRVHDAGLDHGVRKGGPDRIWKAFQPIDYGKQDVLDAAVLEFIHDPEPELRALVLLDPEPEDLLGAVRPHPECHMHGLVANHALVADLHPQGIEKHQRIDCIERPVLPARHLIQHRVRHRADQIRRDVKAVELAQMALDLAHAHAAGVH
jgi:site-specific DNA recombinase